MRGTRHRRDAARSAAPRRRPTPADRSSVAARLWPRLSRDAGQAAAREVARRHARHARRPRDGRVDAGRTHRGKHVGGPVPRRARGPRHAGRARCTARPAAHARGAAATRSTVKASARPKRSARRLRDNEFIPGFGHRVYKNNDPRCDVSARPARRDTARTRRGGTRVDHARAGLAVPQRRLRHRVVRRAVTT